MSGFGRICSGLLLAFAITVVSAPGRADYSDPTVEAAAEEMRAQLRARAGSDADGRQASGGWNAARALVRKKEWAAAVREFESAAIAGVDNPQFWVEFSGALGQRRPPDHRRALHAATLSFLTAQTVPQRALALSFIAWTWENQGEPDKAIAAYQASIDLRPNHQIAQRLEQLIERHRHQVVRSEVESNTETPRICLTFSRDLVADDLSQYGQYVVTEPRITPAFSVSDRTLCIEGVAHGNTYTVTVRAGLRDRAGELSTREAQSFRLAVPNRAPVVSFQGTGYILPRQSRQGIPVGSINVGRAELRLLRINDRNLVAEINASSLRRLLSEYDAREIAREKGEEVWRGSVEIAAQLNRQVTTAIPFDSVLRDTRPGIYVLMARPAPERGDEPPPYESWATQYLIVSDLGLSAYMGTGGLDVFVRSFDSAEPRRRVSVSLVARNNTILATAESDRNGRANFPPGVIRGLGGNAPAAVMARADDGDFAFLDMTRPAFDLTDRGVGGRAAPGPVDAFLYTERGVYRPGETVHLTALVRDDKGVALRDMPVTLELVRPDDVVAQRIVLRESRAGGYTASIPMSAASRTGSWTARLLVDPKEPPVGTVRFQVEDFVPERLEMTLEPKAPALLPDTPNAIAVDGRFLYGAPAADLAVEGEMILRENSRPYAEFPNHRFGLVTETWEAKRVELPATRTDGTGKADLAFGIEGVPETTRPLMAQVRVSLLEPGGRAIDRLVAVPVRSRALEIGIRPESEEPFVAEGTDAGFEIIAVDRDGKRRAAEGLSWRLVRETYQYRWYRDEGGNWRYRILQRDEPAGSGTLDVAAGAPARLAFSERWGRYRLEIRDAGTGAASSTRFTVGWFSTPGADETPDKLTVRLDKDAYKAGETAMVFVKPPFAGEVHLVVASDRVLVSRHVSVGVDGRTIGLRVDDAWGPGVYVTATAYRPMSQREERGPARAIGVAHLRRDMSERTLEIAIDAPDMVRPRGRTDVTVAVTGGDGPVFMTLAAVDEGILSLTGYRTPAPHQHYFGKRRLALEIRDDYGRLIDPYAGTLGRVRSGGDAAPRHLGGLDASSIRTVALFSGIVEVSGGKATIPLDIPDFNGRLRLMAVAFDRSGLGSADRPLTVRDPVVSIVTLPRFLAPGDKGRVTVSLHNVDGAEGPYTLTMSTDGEAGSFAADVSVRNPLARDERKTVGFTLEGRTVGVMRVNMALSGPDGFELRRSWDLAVRPAQAAVTRYESRRIGPGEGRTYTAELLREFLPGTATIDLSFGTTPDLGVPALVRALDRYAYGCVEQTASRALPMLYLADVARSVGIARDEEAIRADVQSAIMRVLAMQNAEGGFGLWSASDPREGWLSAYIMDFLTQARAREYLVPDYAFARGLDEMENITRRTRDLEQNLPVLAYAHYVLAMNRKANLADIRYLADNMGDRMPTALAKAQLAAALALHGDTQRAEAMFAAARGHETRPRLTPAYWEDFARDYGSLLRDRTGVLYLASRSKADIADLTGLISEVARLRDGRRNLSTQEQAWLLLAAHQLSAASGAYRVSIGGKDDGERREPHHLRLAAADLGTGLEVRNTGGDAVWHGVTVTGIPAADMAPEENGFKVERAFYTLDGKQADLATVRQSDVLVVLLRVTVTKPANHQALLVDLLPAGFEIENARLQGRTVEDLPMLPKDLAFPRHVEPRDDRYVAAIDLTESNRVISLAYLVRAVTPGTFRLPASHVEDMYRPDFFARGAMATVTIAPRE